MKAYCILDNRTVYMVGDSSVVPHHNPFFIPDFADRFTAIPAVAIRIGRVGKSIAPRFAHRYVEGVSAGLLIRGMDLLDTLRTQGLPWFKGVAFDGSAPLGVWRKVNETDDVEKICADFSCIYGPTGDLSASQALSLQVAVAQAISDLSSTVMLKNGDVIYIALCAEGIPLERDMGISITDGDECIFSIKIK